MNKTRNVTSHISPDQLYPIMGSSYDEQDYAPISMDIDYLSSINVLSGQDYIDYHQSLRNQYGATWLIGGYLERRAIYSSVLFRSDSSNVRDIHLGVDIWGARHHPIYAPLDGMIHSFAYNHQFLDYGYTLIVKHRIDNHQFFTLYGHLSSSHYDQWTVGKAVHSGDMIGTLGDKNENGGWMPHLHIQVILDMQGCIGDYPGVCCKRDENEYRQNCPDPNAIIIMNNGNGGHSDQ